MREMTVKASELRLHIGEIRPGDIVACGEILRKPVTRIEKRGIMVTLYASDGELSFSGPEREMLNVVRSDPVPDAAQVLRELRGWIQGGHDAVLAAGGSSKWPEFRSTNAGWVVVSTDDLLAKLDELEKTCKP